MKPKILALLKFGKKEDLLKLQKGEIFMNTVKYHRESDKKGAGDEFEGTTDIKNIKNAKITLELPKGPIELKSPSLHLKQHLTGHIGNIYSTYAISSLLVDRKETHKIDNRMSLFGDSCLLIKDPEFITKIMKKLSELNIKREDGLVTYKNFKKNNHQLNPFIKTHLLSYQKEHRVIAHTQNDNPLIFNIGSLKDKSELYETKYLIDNMTVDRE
jgi:hypothetical protein